jgi:putative transposase
MRVAPAIELSTRQHEVLERLVRRATGEQRLAERARIILACAPGGRNLDLAEDLGLDADTVGRWRRRWAAAQEQLATAEESSRGSDLDRCITQTLVDAPRAGCGGTFTPEQIIEIIAIACEQPDEDSQLPVSHWTPRELAEEAVKRKIVPSISVRTVGRFLKSGGS